MSIQTKIYLVIIALWLANYIPRALPMVVLSKLQLPEPLLRWLSFVPAAVLAAMIAPALLMPGNKLAINLQNNHLLAALPAFLIAHKTKSLVWTLLAGMLAMALLQLR